MSMTFNLSLRFYKAETVVVGFFFTKQAFFLLLVQEYNAEVCAGWKLLLEVYLLLCVT